MRFEVSQLAGYIYRTNPFYLISALLFLCAQTVLFNTHDPWIETYVPMGLIAAYTLIMAGAAILIVRSGQVWDDARSIVLIVVALVVVLSVSFDTKILEALDPAVALGSEPRAGGLLGAVALPALGWLFSVGVCELLCRGLRLRLRRPFKVVCYALLGLFFLYPCCVGYLVAQRTEEAAIRAIGLFPALAGVIYLFLVPAVRRGPAYAAADSGSPWGWPWYPWTLFGVLGLGVCARSYLLTLSFFPGVGFGSYRSMDSGFGLYMLIPFLLAVTILALEHGLRVRSRLLQTLVLFAPLVFFLLASPWLSSQGSACVRFASVLTGGQRGSPVLVAFACTFVLYVYSWVRRVKLADFALVTALVVAVMMDAKTGLPATMGVARWMPLYALAAIQAWLAYRTRASWWTFLSLLSMVLAVAANAQGTWFVRAHAAVPFHLVYVGILVIGTLFDDGFARFLRFVGALLMPLLCMGALFARRAVAPGVPAWVVPPYVSVLLLAAAAAYFVLASDWYLQAGLACFGLIGFRLFVRTCRWLGRLRMAGMPAMIAAALVLAVALGISLLKGQVVQRLARTACARLDHARARFRGMAT